MGSVCSCVLTAEQHRARSGCSMDTLLCVQDTRWLGGRQRKEALPLLGRLGAPGNPHPGGAHGETASSQGQSQAPRLGTRLHLWPWQTLTAAPSALPGPLHVSPLGTACTRFPGSRLMGGPLPGDARPPMRGWSPPWCPQWSPRPPLTAPLDRYGGVCVSPRAGPLHRPAWSRHTGSAAGHVLNERMNE